MDMTQLLANFDMSSGLMGGTFVVVIAVLVLIAILRQSRIRYERLEQDYAQQSSQQQLAQQHALAQVSQEKAMLETRLEDLQRSERRLDDELQDLQAQLLDSQTQVARLNERCRHLDRLEEELSEKAQQLQQAQKEGSETGAQLAALKSRYVAETQAAKEKLELLEKAKTQLKTEFEAVAGQLFQKNSEQFQQASQQGLGLILAPLKDQLTDFKKKVEDSYDKEAKDRRALAEQLVYLKQLNQQMCEDANNLTQALKGDSKTQGNWGEVILERVLEASGLRRGKEFEMQVALQQDTRRYQPDVVIRLPEQKDIIVDAKVSLTAYERYCNSDDDGVRSLALKQHAQSVKGHVKGLSAKRYHDLEGVRSLDFVLLFIPIEGAFHTAIEADEELFRYAFDQNIIIVSPATLLVTLRTIHNIWRYEDQSQNARDIARRGGELHDKFVNFVEALEDVGAALDKAQVAHSTAVSRLIQGRGNLVRQAIMLKELGAQGKKELPKDLVNRALDESFGEE